MNIIILVVAACAAGAGAPLRNGVVWTRRSTQKGDFMQSVWRNSILALALAAFAATASNVSAQSKNIGMGTWKLNLEKSKYSPAGFAPKSLTATFEPAGKGVKLNTEGIGPDGKPAATEYTANYDGKDVPLKGSPVADTVSLKRVNALTTVRTDKKDGKVVQTLTRKIAKDGKSFTVAVKGKTAKGEPINHLLVFEKQ